MTEETVIYKIGTIHSDEINARLIASAKKTIHPKLLYCANCKGTHIEELNDGLGMSYAEIKELAEKYIQLRTPVDSKHLFD